jgi:hypothetical protein
MDSENFLVEPTNHTCSKCSYHTSSLSNLKKHVYRSHRDLHEENAGYTHSCPYCKKNFKSQKFLNIHTDKCKEKEKQKNTNALIKLKHLENIVKIEELKIQRMEIRNNKVNTVSSINNPPTIESLLMYDLINPTEESPFYYNHIDIDKYRNMLLQDTSRPDERKRTMTLLTTFIRDIFIEPKNRCFYKKRGHNNHALTMVYTRPGEWVSITDYELYNSIVCSIATLFQVFIGEFRDSLPSPVKIYLKRFLIPYTDYMADEGYVNDIEKAETIKKEFKIITQHTRQHINNISIQSSIQSENESDM